MQYLYQLIKHRNDINGNSRNTLILYVSNSHERTAPDGTRYDHVEYAPRVIIRGGWELRDDANRWLSAAGWGQLPSIYMPTRGAGIPRYNDTAVLDYARAFDVFSAAPHVCVAQLQIRAEELEKVENR